MKRGAWGSCALSWLMLTGLISCGGPASEDPEAVEMSPLEQATEVEQQGLSEPRMVGSETWQAQGRSDVFLLGFEH